MYSAYVQGERDFIEGGGRGNVFDEAGVERVRQNKSLQIYVLQNFFPKTNRQLTMSSSIFHQILNARHYSAYGSFYEIKMATYSD